jgi:hypothetical protein
MMPWPVWLVCTAFTLMGWRVADLLAVLPEGRAVTRWPMMAPREAMVCILIGSMWEKRVSHERAQVESDPPGGRASCFTFPNATGI